MDIKNTSANYGCLAILFHWLTALMILGLFALGWWMVGLDYYSEWYRQAPYIHKSLGILLCLLMFIRFAWRQYNKQPTPEDTMSAAANTVVHYIHLVLYLLFFLIVTSGYLISTADGRAIEVFNWFDVPAIIINIPNQEDIAGEVHELLAWILMALVALHSLGAIKHHFIDKDRTLKKMLGL